MVRDEFGNQVFRTYKRASFRTICSSPWAETQMFSTDALSNSGMNFGSLAVEAEVTKGRQEKVGL